MLHNKYIFAGALCVSLFAHGAASEKKRLLQECFDQRTVPAPGEKCFYETIFIEDTETAFGETKPHIRIRAAIVSGPDEEFVKSVAEHAALMRLKTPNCRSDDESNHRFLMAVLRRVVGDNISLIQTAKQTSIEIMQGQCPARFPYDILVPGELRSFLKDLDYSTCSDSAPSVRFEALKAYMNFVNKDEEKVHQALVLIPNKKTFKEYAASK